MRSKKRSLLPERHDGYTFLELVVAVGILGLLAVAATALFLSALRGGSKVEVGTEVKQNGQFALNGMEQLIRNSLSVSNCSPTPASSLILTARDGKTLTFSCVNIGQETGHIASNSARLTSVDVAVTRCSFSCNQDPVKLRGPLVTINFSLRQAGTSATVAETAQADFSTSVSLRSY